MLADVKYYDTDYKYVYTQWIQPTLTANNQKINGMSVNVNYQAFAPNTGSAGFYVNEGYGENWIYMYFDEYFIPSSLSYRIYTGSSASSGSYNNRFYVLTDEYGWYELKTHPNTAEGKTVHYDFTGVPYAAKAFKFVYGNGGHSYEDSLTIYGIRLAGRIRTIQPVTPGLWSQPILQSNGIMGVDNFAVSTNVEQLSPTDSKNMYYADEACVHDAYKAFTGSNLLCFHSAENVTTGHIDIWSKKALKVTKINIYNQAYTTSLGSEDVVDNRASAAGTIYGSNDGITWTKIKDYTNSIQSIAAKWSIDMSNNNTYWHYYRIDSSANGGASYWTIGEIELEALQEVSSSNPTLPDLTKTNAKVSLPYLTTRKYYKYRNISWTPPILTGPSTADFIVSTDVRQYTIGTYEAWKLFDGNASTLFHSASGFRTGHIEWWSKYPLNITNLHIKNQSSYANRASAGGRIMGSNDGDIWETVKTFTNDVQAANAEWDIDMSNNNKYYSYYRFYNDTPGPDTSYWTMAEIQITASAKEIINGTSSSYDFYKDINDFKAIKHYKKGQLLCKL